MIARSFFLAVMSLLPGSRRAAVRGGLQPRLRRRHALLEGADLVRVLEREADVVEAFEQAHAVGGRNVEGEHRAVRAADALGFEIDRERRRAVPRPPLLLQR